MLTVEEAQTQILEWITLLGSEKVTLLASLGRVLAEAIVAPRDIPPWANSAMDGFALQSAETAGAASDRPVALKVVGTIPAGALPSRPLSGGEAIRIFTGAPLPEGADSVIPQEEVAVENGRVLVRRPVGVGECVRPSGEDVRAGEEVLAIGSEITPAEIGLLASLGRSTVEVYHRPRVAILSTGDELVDIDREQGPGKIINSNSYSLMAQVLEAGGVPVNLGIAPDNLAMIEERLRWGLSADLLVSSAGVSVGDYDFVREALEQAGATLHLWQVAMRPGKPITFGMAGHTPVFGLPGNPVSAMVTFELFVRPALRKMAGHRQLARTLLAARAAEPIENPGQRRSYLRVTLHKDGDALYARLTGNQGSAILKSMTQADGLAVVPPDTTIASGGPVSVIPLRSNLTRDALLEVS
jgi:molybdopterin molybdotransferase